MSVYEQMLKRYKSNETIDEHNANCEVMQQIALAGLYRGGFFQKAAFYGGTCLRIFHAPHLLRRHLKIPTNCNFVINTQCTEYMCPLKIWKPRFPNFEFGKYYIKFAKSSEITWRKTRTIIIEKLFREFIN